MVRPLGFEVSDKYLKRAGLDYWEYLEIHYYDSIEELMDKHYKGDNFWFFSTKAKNIHSDVKYKDGDFLVFGKETKGLPEELLVQNPDTCVRLPMREGLRSLNLSNTVAIAVYEILRQSNFEGLQGAGELTRFAWDD